MRSPRISRVKLKVRCSEGRNENCEENRTGQRFKADNVDLLIFTDGSANEECNDFGAEFEARKIKDDQI